MEVKIFSANSKVKLEKELNEFLKPVDNKHLDIHKISFSTDSEKKFTFLGFKIFYEPVFHCLILFDSYD